MGWKLSCLVASTVEYPGLADGLSHESALADRFVKALPQRYQQIGLSTFEYGSYPSNGNLYVGAYGDCLLIGDLRLAASSFEGEVPPVIEAIETVLPGAWVLALELHSVVNLFGYALFQQGQIVRARAGCTNEGVTLDIGEPLPEELPLLEKRRFNDQGELVWLEEVNGQTTELNQSSMGEEFVFAVAARAFGQPLDWVDYGRLLMSEYRPPHTWLSRIAGWIGG